VVPPASHKISRVSWYSGFRPTHARRPLRDSHPLWSDVPVCSSIQPVLVVGPTTPPFPKETWFGLVPVRSPLLRESRLISFRRATEMFQFTRFPPSLPMCSAGGLQTSLWRSCLIRTLKDQRLYAAPLERFAGLRVLLRPFAPRHSPRTLCSLFFFSFTAFLAVLCFNVGGCRSTKLKYDALFDCSGAGSGEPQPLKSGNQTANLSRVHADALSCSTWKWIDTLVNHAP
jgi:hypothetical protein